MVSLSAHIAIEGLQPLQTYVAVHCQSSHKQLTDTCKLELTRPEGLSDNDLRQLLKPGKRITVQLGYDNRLHPVFVGYIARVSPTSPVEVECEDEMWALKRGTRSMALAQTKLSAVVAQLVPGTVLNLQDAVLGAVRIDRLTPALALAELGKTTGLPLGYRLLRNGTTELTNRPYSRPDQQRVQLHLDGPNCNVVSHDLRFVSTESRPVKLKAIHQLPTGQTQTRILGSDEGAEYIRHYYNQPDWQTLAQNEYDNLNLGGLQGSVTCFGEPLAYPGDVLDIRSFRWPDLNGRVYVDGVGRTFGPQGYRQQFNLGKTAR